jgi:hypothetical protein
MDLVKAEIRAVNEKMRMICSFVPGAWVKLLSKSCALLCQG